MATSRALTILAVAMAALTSAVAGTAASSNSTGAVACTLLPATELRSVMGQSQSIVLRNHDAAGPVAPDIDTECGWGVWSGPPPTSTSAMFALARSGRAGQAGIETWAPHPGHQQDWVDRQFDELSGNLLKGTLVMPGFYSSRGLPAHIVHVPHLGHDGSGFTTAGPGLAKGLKVSVGCWWEDKTYKAICVMDEEAAFKPVTAHMLQFAKTAVPKFLG